jgi:hypothetical protein
MSITATDFGLSEMLAGGGGAQKRPIGPVMGCRSRARRQDVPVVRAPGSLLVSKRIGGVESGAGVTMHGPGHGLDASAEG